MQGLAMQRRAVLLLSLALLVAGTMCRCQETNSEHIPECVSHRGSRSVCRVPNGCVSGDGVIVTHSADLAPTCRDLTVMSPKRNCKILFHRMLQEKRAVHIANASTAEIADATAILPNPVNFGGNVYHFGRHLLFSLHVVWNPELYGVRKVDYLFFNDRVGNATRWNKGLSAALLDADLQRLPYPNAGDELRCFRNLLLLSKDLGTIFQNSIQPPATLDTVAKHPHLPTVPADALRFKKRVTKSLGLASERLTGVDVSNSSVVLDAPRRVIAFNDRGLGNSRSFSPRDHERLLDTLKDFAKRRRFELRINKFGRSQSFRSQVDAMADVGLVVGIHGANMMNAVFMPPLSSLIEIFPAFYFKECYVAGGNGGLQYTYVVARDDSVRNCFDGSMERMRCEVMLKRRRLHMNDDAWRDLGRKLEGTAAYIDVLEAEAPVTLRRVGDVYELPSDLQDRIISRWNEEASTR